MTGKQITITKCLILKLKVEMQERGLSIQDVSELTGYHVDTINVVIYDSQDCTYEYLFKILINIYSKLGIFNAIDLDPDLTDILNEMAEKIRTPSKKRF